MSTFAEPPPSKTYGLVVRSVGRAGAAERQVLASLLGIPLEALTAALLRAPTQISVVQVLLSPAPNSLSIFDQGL